MFKETVVFWDVARTEEGYDEVERELVVRFNFTIKAFKLFEEMQHSNFFDEYEDAVKEFTNELKRTGININKLKELDSEELFGLIPLVANSKISSFLLKAIPCLYVEIIDGKLVQNVETFETCSISDWLINLVSVEFFVKLFEEVTAFRSKKKTTKKK